MIRIAAASVRSRKIPTILVILALTTSMALLLAVDRIQDATKKGFNQSLGGVDLVLGPRGSGIELILYTVFHLGRPTNNITTETLKDIERSSLIDWVIPDRTWRQSPGLQSHLHPQPDTLTISNSVVTSRSHLVRADRLIN